LEAHLHNLEEAKRRDHKKLGPQLELFFFSEYSPGMPYWLPNGVILLNELINFWREEHAKRGYQEIISPILNKKDLYVTSGHYDHYWSDMFKAETSEKEVYGVKAMNCPNAMVTYGFKKHSYKEFPLRLSDTDPLHRDELSGTLNGLLRARQFRQDDAHIFVTEEMIKDEYLNVFEIVERFYSIFSLEYSFRLGTRPEDFMGDIDTWNRAEETLKQILEESGKDYFIEEGDGAFYGPKVDILMKDALGRSWQMGTIQLDFQQPRNFKLTYTDADGSEKTPIAIHRVIYGSLERFIGIITEHFVGAFPTWLAPQQVKIIPISEKHNEYAFEIEKSLLNENVRVSTDTRSETMQSRIRDAQLQKIPYMIVVGDREMDEKKISVRARSGENKNGLELEAFLNDLKQEIIDKK
jgi:threonyl-tRNA synthetase